MIIIMGIMSFQFRVFIQNLYTYILLFQNYTFHAFALANIKTGSISSMFRAIMDRVGLGQWCTTSGPRARSGPRRVLMWPATSNMKSDFLRVGTDIKSTVDH